MKTKNKKGRRQFVAYYRVSTGKQAVEMPTQKTAVKNYLKTYWPPSASFTEIESGKSAKNRPELQKALAYCKEHKATLVVAKLDRLSRDLAFIATLQDNQEIDFVCCDMPQATKETIAFMGIMARWEREQIAKRTKEALAEKRKSGVKLGSHNPKVMAGLKRFRKRQAIEMDKKRKAKKAEREKAKAFKKKGKAQGVIKPSKRELDDQKVLPAIKCLRGHGLSFMKVANSLNKEGVPTRQGGKWTDTGVIRICKRNGL